MLFSQKYKVVLINNGLTHCLHLLVHSVLCCSGTAGELGWIPIYYLLDYWMIYWTIYWIKMYLLDKDIFSHLVVA